MNDDLIRFLGLKLRLFMLTNPNRVPLEGEWANYLVWWIKEYERNLADKNSINSESV